MQKTKVMFNLTKWQILCFLGGGALIGVPLFLSLKAIMAAGRPLHMLVMLPFFLLASGEKNGQPPEKLISQTSWQVCFLRPKQRPYRTNNFYDLAELGRIFWDKEVYAIVHKQNPARKLTEPSESRSMRRLQEPRPDTSWSAQDKHPLSADVLPTTCVSVTTITS